MARRESALPLVSRHQGAQVFGISSRSFERLEAEGVLPVARPGRGGRPSLYDLTVVGPAYLAHVEKRNGSAHPADARARRDASQAELNELRLAERRHDLLPRDQVVLEGQAFIAAVRGKLRGLPRQMARAGLIPPAGESAVTGLVHEALSEFARWSSMLDLRRAAPRGK